MPNWGLVLLAGFVALGLTDRLSRRKATRYAVILAAVVLVFELGVYGGLR